MNNKDLSPLGVLVAALKEAVRAQHKARLKVESTEAWLLKHQQEVIDRGAVTSKLHKAISVLSPPATTAPELREMIDNDYINPHVAKTEFLDPKSAANGPHTVVCDKDIYDPFGYGQDTPFHYNPSKTNCGCCGEPGCGGC